MRSLRRTATSSKRSPARSGDLHHFPLEEELDTDWIPTGEEVRALFFARSSSSEWPSAQGPRAAPASLSTNALRYFARIGHSHELERDVASLRSSAALGIDSRVRRLESLVNEQARAVESLTRELRLLREQAEKSEAERLAAANSRREAMERVLGGPLSADDDDEDLPPLDPAAFRFIDIDE